MKTIRIGSRESKLAVVQSNLVIDTIKEYHPEIEVELITMKTTGDKILDKSLELIGGKGLFIKELDIAMVEGRIDLSVHSLKDMPMEIPQEHPLVAFSRREDPRDVLILPKDKSDLDFSLPIGCSSKRRILQLHKIYPDAKFSPVRGNVITRLEKLDRGEYSGLILAAAGIKRLGLEDRVSRYFTTKEIIPAAGQGIMAVQGKQEFCYDFIKEVNDEISHYCAIAERSFVRTLDGGCTSPVAAFAEIEHEVMHLSGLYYCEEDNQYLTGKISGHRADGEFLGKELAKELEAKYKKSRRENG